MYLLGVFNQTQSIYECTALFTGGGKLGPGKATYSFPWMPNVPLTPTCFVAGSLLRRIIFLPVPWCKHAHRDYHDYSVKACPELVTMIPALFGVWFHGDTICQFIALLRVCVFNLHKALHIDSIYHVTIPISINNSFPFRIINSLPCWDLIPKPHW